MLNTGAMFFTDIIPNGKRRRRRIMNDIGICGAAIPWMSPLVTMEQPFHGCLHKVPAREVTIRKAPQGHCYIELGVSFLVPRNIDLLQCCNAHGIILVEGKLLHHFIVRFYQHFFVCFLCVSAWIWQSFSIDIILLRVGWDRVGKKSLDLTVCGTSKATLIFCTSLCRREREKKPYLCIW